MRRPISLHLGAQGVVEDLDATRLRAQDGVAVLAHVGERRLGRARVSGSSGGGPASTSPASSTSSTTSGDCSTSAMAPF